VYYWTFLGVEVMLVLGEQIRSTLITLSSNTKKQAYYKQKKSAKVLFQEGNSPDH